MFRICIIYLLGSICGLFDLGRGKSVGGEEKQCEDEEHGGRFNGDGDWWGWWSCVNGENSVFSGALSGKTLIETDAHYVSIL